MFFVERDPHATRLIDLHNDNLAVHHVLRALIKFGIKTTKKEGIPVGCPLDLQDSLLAKPIALFKTSPDDDWKTKHINTKAPDRFAFFIDNETSECHAFHLRDMEPTLAGAPANAYDMLDVH